MTNANDETENIQQHVQEERSEGQWKSNNFESRQINLQYNDFAQYNDDVASPFLFRTFQMQILCISGCGCKSNTKQLDFVLHIQERCPLSVKVLEACG